MHLEPTNSCFAYIISDSTESLRLEGLVSDRSLNLLEHVVIISPKLSTENLGCIKLLTYAGNILQSTHTLAAHHSSYTCSSSASLCQRFKVSHPQSPRHHFNERNPLKQSTTFCHTPDVRRRPPDPNRRQRPTIPPHPDATQQRTFV